MDGDAAYPTKLEAIHLEVVSMRQDITNVMAELLKVVSALSAVIGSDMSIYTNRIPNECLLELARALSYDRPGSPHFETARERIKALVKQERAEGA